MKAATLNIVIKVLCHERDHGKYEDFDSIPEDYRKDLELLDMALPDLICKIDNYRDYLRSFLGAELCKSLNLNSEEDEHGSK